MSKIEENYLTNIPDNVRDHGFCKTLIVRKEIIHLKHILTEVFIRKSINIEEYLNKIGMTLFEYMQFITQRIRNVHNFSRKYVNDPNKIVKNSYHDFFPSLDLINGLKKVIVLDFDGVITSKKFHKLYELCNSRERVEVCSANPTINNEWFDKNGLSRPNKINSMKGKVRKIKRLIEIQKKYDYVYYVDNEKEYLKFGWLFGIQTFHWNNKTIKHFSLIIK